ncbi:MAG: M4 family metallopeptidase, partial [Phycisphaerales bacterium]|nr:M4 family metallopeptidase [Phycisphaerales bacterium]
DAEGSGAALDYVLGPDADWQQYDERGATVATPSDPARETWEFAARIHDYWNFTFDRDSYDGRGSTLDAIVRFDQKPGNASFVNERMFFATGMHALDVYQHEFTHAVIERTARLSKTGEAGTVAEALCDFFAVMIEPETIAPWGIGETTVRGTFRNHRIPNGPSTLAGRVQLWSSGEGECMVPDDCGPDRTCVEPDGECASIFCVPLTCVDTRCVELPDRCANDSGHIHDNAMVVGHVLYQMTDGTVSSDLGTRDGIGSVKAEQIVYRALTEGYLGPASGYRQLASALEFACSDFLLRGTLGTGPTFDITPEDCGVVINAFHNAGMRSFPDGDYDAVPDNRDNCPGIANPEQDDIECLRVRIDGVSAMNVRDRETFTALIEGGTPPYSIRW